MQGMGETGEACPFEFNFDEKTFKAGDTVSYRVHGSLEGFPFVGTLVEVHDDYVLIAGDPNDPDTQIGRASCRETVCQEVSISVVAVSLKQKNTIKPVRCSTYQSQDTARN